MNRPPPNLDETPKAYTVVGERLRKLRRANGLSLRQLSELTGKSASFISQLERGLSGASTSTLIGLANCFGTNISELFDEAGASEDNPVMRKHERPSLPEMHGQRKTLLSRRPLTQFETYLAEFQPGGSTGAEAYSHGASHEMLVVLKGTVVLTLGDRDHVMDQGDCAEYMSSTPHRVENTGTTEAEVMFIISPPTSTAKNLRTSKKV